MDLKNYNNDWYNSGNKFKIISWMVISAIFFRHSLSVGVSLKIKLLRLFGAKIGKGVILKQSINIKYPWKLEIGDYTWIGENVWIDNLEQVIIGSNVCISQEAYLLTGNHNYTLSTFDLIVKPITINDCAWVGAKAIVCPGIVCGFKSILTVGSVATKNLETNGIYQGNPAVLIKTRA